MAILFIDTSSSDEICVGLEVDGKEYKEKKKIDKNRSQAVLPMIDDLLKQHDISPTDLKAIEVVKGPGSFTGLRVGIAIANTLSQELGIPVNGKKPGTIIEPVYS